MIIITKRKFDLWAGTIIIDIRMFGEYNCILYTRLRRCD